MKTVEIIFPKINKNNSLYENDQYIMLDCEESISFTKCAIKKSVVLNKYEYSRIKNDFLSDNDIYEKIGGSESNDPRLEKWDYMSYTEKLACSEYMEIFRETSRTNVIEFICPDEPAFYVNTEGYNYARYVGRSKKWLDDTIKPYLEKNIYYNHFWQLYANHHSESELLKFLLESQNKLMADLIYCCKHDELARKVLAGFKFLKMASEYERLRDIVRLDYYPLFIK